MNNVAIIGSGPAGYTSAIYTSRANLQPHLYTGFLSGGQLMNTSDVENYPGFSDGILGPDLMNEMCNQALRFGTTMFSSDVTSLTKTKDGFLISDNVEENHYKAVILATGASPKWLGVKGESEFLGKGVTSCAVCDGFFYKGKNVVVVGAGDTAMEEALFLSKICSHVTLLNRGNTYKASKIMVDKVKATENIHILENSSINLIQGENNVNSVVVDKKDEDRTILIETSAVFVAIGLIPNSDLVKHLGIVGADGYIDSCNTLTAIPGLFAAGDVADRKYKQAITSAGSGCMAALEVERYLNSL
jgi:thioredoxin reductase (NADPH)